MRKCTDFVQHLHSFMACSHGTRFLPGSYVHSMRKSKKKKLHYFPLTVILKCRKWHPRGTYLNFFPRAASPWTPLDVHACGDHGHGYARPN